MKRKTFTIETLEDLHIGTGTGRGDIDSLQVRDRHGRPLLPSSHIKGVLRDLARQWHELAPADFPAARIDQLFGHAGGAPGRLQLTSAYLDDERPTLLWGSTRIDPLTGTAQEKTLRFVEYLPAGARLRMQAAIEPADPEDERLFLALVGRCRHLGGGRNRGDGRIRWHHETAPPPPPLRLTRPPTLPARLRILLRNLDPVCFARTGHPGNLIATESRIPGRALRGAFVANSLQQDHELARLLLSPTLSWGDALPLPDPHPEDGTLAECDILPIPLSIGTPKATASTSELPWWATASHTPHYGERREIDQILAQTPPEEKLKRPADDEYLFRPTAHAPWLRYQPQILERLHTRVPVAHEETEQALFSTEEIAEGTAFLADLIVTETAQAEALDHLLQTLSAGWLRLGRGGKPFRLEQACWLPAKTHPRPHLSRFVLLLESELIARDTRGNFHDRLDAHVVAALAGMPQANVQATKNFSEGSERFGFNALTGLPRHAQRTIKAGSAILVEGPDAGPLAQALAQRLALGECPEEGFGRFRLDDLPQPHTAPTAHSPSPPPPVSREERLCAEAKDWMERLCAEAKDWMERHKPSDSQWNDFRARVQAARTREELEAVFDAVLEAADKHGGAAWKGFADNLAPLRDALHDRPLPDVQRLLDDLVRWIRATKRPAVHPECPQ